MKRLLEAGAIADGGVIIACSSHEDRCKGLLAYVGGCALREVVLLHYNDPNPGRERNHRHMMTAFQRVADRVTDLPFTEASPVASLRANVPALVEAVRQACDAPIVLDISVLTRRHLLMMLRWLDDRDLWDRLTVVYSEPADYVVSRHIPLSFGLMTLQEIPGFSACSDLSRPVHLMMFLGYEGDRALAVYEQTQPMKTTLVIPHPPYQATWKGRTEEFNRDLLALVGEDAIVKGDPVDPDATHAILTTVLGADRTADEARIVCPLGTKPQTLGTYSFTRQCSDPPAIIYASPLRHNHTFFSDGVGRSWLLKSAGT